MSTEEDYTILQKDLDSLQAWSNKWLLKFHPDKCKIMTIGSQDTQHLYYMSDTPLSRTDHEKDVGVTFDGGLNFRREINARITRANNIMGTIRRTYSYLDPDSFRSLFTTLVRPHLEYGAAVWYPTGKKEITDLENVQRRATRQVPAFKGMTYPERLAALKLPSLRFRRLRGDMIETFKLISGVT